MVISWSIKLYFIYVLGYTKLKLSSNFFKNHTFIIYNVICIIYNVYIIYIIYVYNVSIFFPVWKWKDVNFINIVKYFPSNVIILITSKGYLNFIFYFLSVTTFEDCATYYCYLLRYGNLDLVCGYFYFIWEKR